MVNKENSPSLRELKDNGEGDNVLDLLEEIYADEDFSPTPLMCKLLIAFVADNEDRLPPVVLRDECGSNRNLWYMWRKRDPKFMVWWNRCLEAVYSGFGVPEVWQAVKKRAINHSDAAAKLFIERFDTKYKPTTAQEQRHSFGGYRPDETTKELAEKSRERQKKQVQSNVTYEPLSDVNSPDTKTTQAIQGRE